MTTGWPPYLLQDDSRKLSDWFASRVDARWTVRQVCAEIERKRMTTTPLPPLPDHAGRVTPSGVFTFVGLSLMGGGKVYTNAQMQAYATQARADLEAEVQRLREALTSAAPVAQQPQADEATSAGLEASISILSQLVDEQRQLLAEVDAVFGVDAHGIVLEDGDSALIDRVRAHLAATSEAKQPQAEAVPPDVARDAERWRTFLATRPANTHAVINDAIDAAMAKGEKS